MRIHYDPVDASQPKCAGSAWLCPQRGARKAYAREHDRLVLQQMHAEPRRLGARQLQLFGKGAVIKFMVAHHHDDRHAMMWRFMAGREVEPRARRVGRVSEA